MSGYPASGHPGPGYPGSGYAPPGYAPSGYAPSGYAPSGYAPSGYAPSGYAPPGYAPPGYPAPGQPGVSGWPGTAMAQARIDVVQGTGFGVAYPRVPPIPSGPSIGSLVAGIASILVSFVVGCFGFAGASSGWGAAVSGAFAILSVLLGVAAIWLGMYGLRQIRRLGSDAVTGRGMAISGVSCGAAGVGLTVLAFLVSLVATL